MTKPKQHTANLHSMTPEEINTIACNMLDRLLECCTLHLVSSVTGISRTTLYKWQDESIPLDSMNHRDAAWLILNVETNPKIAQMLQRGPTKFRRQASFQFKDEEDV